MPPAKGQLNKPTYLCFFAFLFLLHLKMKKIVSEFSRYLGPHYFLNDSENPLVLHFISLVSLMGIRKAMVMKMHWEAFLFITLCLQS